MIAHLPQDFDEAVTIGRRLINRQDASGAGEVNAIQRRRPVEPWLPGLRLARGERGVGGAVAEQVRHPVGGELADRLVPGPAHMVLGGSGEACEG